MLFGWNSINKHDIVNRSFFPGGKFQLTQRNAALLDWAVILFMAAVINFISYFGNFSVILAVIFALYFGFIYGSLNNE